MRENTSAAQATAALLGLALLGSPAFAGFRAHRVAQQPQFESATLQLLESLQDQSTFGGATRLDLGGSTFTALEPELLVSVAEADALVAPNLDDGSVWVEAMSSADAVGSATMIASAGSPSGGVFFGTNDGGVDLQSDPIQLASLGVTVAGGDDAQQSYASGDPLGSGDGPSFSAPDGFDPIGGGNGGFQFVPPTPPVNWRDRPPVELVPLPPPLALGIAGLIGVWFIRRRMTSG